MVSMVVGELYLPFSLREDEENIGGHKKRRGIGELLQQEKSIVVPQYDSFMGIRGGIGDLLELL
jgi:hypothetical protein